MRIAIIIAIYLCFPILIAIGFQKWNIVRKIGTVIPAYAVGIIMSLTGLVSFEAGSADAEQLQSVQKWIMNITVPLAIPLMLLNSDFKLWSKTLSKTVYALIGGLLSVLVAVVIAFFAFRNADIDNFPDILAMMVGIYTGGTMNFAALGTALHINTTIMTCLMTIEMLITFPYLLFVIGGGFKLFRRILPFHETEQSSIQKVKSRNDGVENYEHMLDRRIAPYTAIAVGISLIFLAVGALISLALTGMLQEMIVILTVTTLAIIASFFPKIRRLPKTFEMGMILILIFSIDVASQLDFSMLASSMTILLYLVLFIMLISIILHCIFCRLTKVHGDLFTVANIGLLCSPPFIAPVVGAMGNKSVLISGIAIGIVGYAIGTYFGIGIDYLFNALMQ